MNKLWAMYFPDDFEAENVAEVRANALAFMRELQDVMDKYAKLLPLHSRLELIEYIDGRRAPVNDKNMPGT